jgi:hypothetical protein
VIMNAMLVARRYLDFARLSSALCHRVMPAA